ncbi:hypothetical protein ACFLS5_01595 [Candidatus Bipolaricaulota bacterium]
MIRRTCCTALLLFASVALPLAAGTLSGSTSLWIAFDPIAGALDALDLGYAVDYTLGAVTLSTDGLFVLSGTWVWQGFSAVGRFGGYGLTTNVLFGPSTVDYLYAEAIVELSLAGIDVAWHAAQLSNAVLGGPADGFAIRLAGSIGTVDVISMSELGAKIKDDDFDGITIVHAGSGLERSYVTDPVVFGQGFTGQKVTVSGLSFGCVNDITTTLYVTCAGFDFLKFELEGIDVGLSWLTFDVELTFQTQTKSIVLVPTLVLGDALCIDLYAEVLTDAPVGTDTTNTLFDAYNSITGIGIYGLGFSTSWNGVTVRELTVLNTGRYAITTPEYGSVIEEIVEALENGHDYYADYWEMLSIEVVGDGCCGGTNRFLANTYFNRSETALFGWGMTYIEGEVAINSTISLSTQLEVSTDGADYYGFGIEASW